MRTIDDVSLALLCRSSLGAGQFYLISIKDKDGDSYDGLRAAVCPGDGNGVARLHSE